VVHPIELPALGQPERRYGCPDGEPNRVWRG